MAHTPEEKSSRHLIAPELLPGLELFPDFNFDAGLEAFRRPIDPAMFPPLPENLAVISCEERFIPGMADAPDVRVLHYSPPGKTAAPRPAILHIHGGGYVLGSPDMNDAGNRAFAAALDCVVVSVDYRLAPETAFPGAVEDCYAVLRWMQGEASQLGIDPGRIAIAGESAGGGHAAALAIHARNQDGPAICLQLLDSPMIDDRTGSSNDPHPYCGEFVWTAGTNRFGWRALLGMEPGGADVPAHAVPARVENLSSLPPTFISIGALDLFLEESLEFARRLTRAGVPVELHVIPGAYHGFGRNPAPPQVQQVAQLKIEALRRSFAAAGPA